MIFLNINHFSLIIFYHSVWLGFELFGLRVQVYSQLVQFTLASKGYDNHHCHNKPPDRKWSWSVEDVMIWKRVGWEVDIGPWSRVFGDSAIESKSWVFRISAGRDELRSKTPRDVPNVGGGVSIVWLRKTFKNCVSLLVSKNRSQKLINPSYLNNRVRLYLYCVVCIYIRVVYNTSSSTNS